MIVYEPNWADEMARYLLILVAGLPLAVLVYVWSLFSEHGSAFMKEVTKGETK